MKIIHIIENLDNSYGGPARSVPLLVKYLDKLGIENIIFSVKVFENEENTVLKDNPSIKVIKTPLNGISKLKYSSSLKSKIENEIKENTIIHIHTLWSYPAYIGYKLAKKYDLPLVVSSRGMLYPWALNQSKIVKQIAMKIFVKDMLKTADFIHITETKEEEAIRKLNINTKCILVPNGIEMEHKYNSLDDDVLQRIKYNKNKRYIMFLGRIVHNKGLHYLINSYKQLKDKYTNVEVLVVGGIEDEAYFNSLEQMDGVHFLGQLDGLQKHTIFSISSLFVLPSKSENFGISIAEAMSYRLAVITTTGTPWQEIQEKDAGWWIELNQENLDEALDEALNCNKEYLKAKGNNGFGIIKHYIWDKQALKIKQVYKNILKRD
jgi:glycosyltransferase involved in cell wall biosynthesis